MAKARAGDFVERYCEPESIAPPEKLYGCARIRGSLQPVIEPYDRHFEDGGNDKQASGPYPVRPFFVLLNLLEGDAELFSKIGLRHVSGDPVESDIGAN